MRLILLLVFTSLSSFAGQSLRVTSASGTGSIGFSLPNKVPWTTIAGTSGRATSQPMRWELRVHNFDAAYNTYAYAIGVGTIAQSGTSVSFGPQVPTWDQVARGQNTTTTGSDITIRVQRDVANSRYTLEACNVATGVCTYDPHFSQINAFSNPSFGNQQWYIKPGRSVAFLRWYSSVVPMGTPIPLTGEGDLANWDFERSAVDSVHGLAFAALGDAVVSYIPTPSYGPICNAGTSQSFRAGYAGTLDGSKSQSLDETSLNLTWQQLSGPTTVTWSDRTGVSPTIGEIVAGEYMFQLQVKTSNYQPATCTVTHAAVATDDNDVVLTGNTTIDTLIGPQIRFGASPWPWFDDRHRAAADVRIAYMDTDYPAYWENENSGTVSATHGSASVTGYGTTFLSSVCDGTGKGLASIVIQYPHTDGRGVGYVKLAVARCASDTSLTLSTAYPAYSAYPAPFPDAVAQHWGDDRGRAWWPYTAAPSNYYDNVAAFYSLYYRSGLTAYRTAARKLADRFWKSPEVDRGRFPEFVGRMASPLGLILRSIDDPPSDITAGLHQFWDFVGKYIGKDNDLPAFDYQWGYGELWDIREVGYHLNHIAYCALVDPDPAYRTKCRRWLGQAISQLFQPRQQPDGSWGQPYGRMSDAGVNSWVAPLSSALLTNGSAAVTGVGTSWTQAHFPAYIWFTNLNPAAVPQKGGDGDSVAYRATWSSATSLTLDRPYEGTTGTHGWQTSESSYVGYGVQPFMEGILSIGFDLAAKALAVDDHANAALAARFHLDTVNWLMSVGYQASTRGMYYMARSPSCTGAAYTHSLCDGGQDFNFETNLAAARAFVRTRHSAYRDFSDLMFNDYWAKPGTCPVDSTLCLPSPVYGSAFDDNGYYMTAAGAGGRGSKWFGGAWGFSGLASIPALRGAPPAAHRIPPPRRIPH